MAIYFNEFIYIKKILVCKEIDLLLKKSILLGSFYQLICNKCLLYSVIISLHFADHWDSIHYSLRMFPFYDTTIIHEKRIYSWKNNVNVYKKQRLGKIWKIL